MVSGTHIYRLRCGIMLHCAVLGCTIYQFHISVFNHLYCILCSCAWWFPLFLHLMLTWYDLKGNLLIFNQLWCVTMSVIYVNEQCVFFLLRTYTKTSLFICQQKSARWHEIFLYLCSQTVQLSPVHCGYWSFLFGKRKPHSPFFSVLSSHVALFFVFFYLLQIQPSFIKSKSCQWWITAVITL